jgi:hypothetical protein
VDWVFPAWMLYVEYATQRIIETFQLTEEERSQLLDFRDTMKRLLLEAWIQAKEKLTSIYKAVVEGTYRIEGKRLYVPDGTWMYINEKTAPKVHIYGISAETCFPDILKLPHKKLELLQLGWRASDEGTTANQPAMGTSQPWQLFAWIATRPGTLYIHIGGVNLTRKGVSVILNMRAKDWKQKWSKDEAIDHVMNYLKLGEWTPIFTMWLGDGESRLNDVLYGRYKLVIASKQPWRLGPMAGRGAALIARGRKTFEKLREVAGTYGTLLDLLGSHKWVSVKLVTDDVFRATYKSKKKRYIDVLRKMYNTANDIINISNKRKTRSKIGKTVTIAGVEMSFCLWGRGSLFARRYVSDSKRALNIASRLETVGIAPNVLRSGHKFVVYVNMSDLLKLAEKDETIRTAMIMYLADKVKNGTPRQREIANRLMKEYPLFNRFIVGTDPYAQLRA